jgi:hypothetical protein
MAWALILLRGEGYCPPNELWWPLVRREAVERNR